MKSKAMLNGEGARSGQPEMGAEPKPQPDELPMEAQIAQAVSEILERKRQRKAKNAAALKTTVEASLAPVKHEHTKRNGASASFEQGHSGSREADREMASASPLTHKNRTSQRYRLNDYPRTLTAICRHTSRHETAEQAEKYG